MKIGGPVTGMLVILLCTALAACLFYFYLTINTLAVYNASSQTVTAIRLVAANRPIWQGDLAPDTSGWTWFFPGHDGQIVFEGKVGDTVIREEFGYVTHGLGGRHNVRILPDGRVVYRVR